MQYKLLAGISICAVFLAIISCNSLKHSSTKAMPGTWQATPIVIDGDSKDWPSPYPNYDSKALVAYATSNDKQYLYVTVETGDALTQVKILKRGMTVSIDTTGKKESQFSINYPLENDNEDVEIKLESRAKSAEMQGYENRKMQQSVDRMMQSANQFTLEGFNGCSGGYIINQTSPCGIKVRAHIDEYKELVWEAAIPFKAIYNKDVITAADASRPISVCFAINSFPHPKKEDNNGNSAGAPAGGSMNNGMGGAGRNSSMRSGGTGKQAIDPMQYIYEHTKTWKQFSIAYQ